MNQIAKAFLVVSFALTPLAAEAQTPIDSGVRGDAAVPTDRPRVPMAVGIPPIPAVPAQPGSLLNSALTDVQLCLASCPPAQVCGSATQAADLRSCLNSASAACQRIANRMSLANVVVGTLCASFNAPLAPPVDPHTLAEEARRRRQENERRLAQRIAACASGPMCASENTESRRLCLDCCSRGNSWTPNTSGSLARFMQVSGMTEMQIRCTSSGQATTLNIVSHLADAVESVQGVANANTQRLAAADTRIAALEQRGGGEGGSRMNDALVAVASMSEARRQRSDIEHQISICMVNTRLAVLEGRSVDQARRVREVLQGEANNGPPPGPDDFECVLTALWPADQRPAYCRQQRTTVVARAFTPRAPEQNDNCTLPELQEGIEMIDAQIAELGDAFRRRFNADPRVILQVSREEMVACATTPESDRCRAAHAQLVAMLAGRTPPELLMRNVAATPSRPSHYGTE